MPRRIVTPGALQDLINLVRAGDIEAVRVFLSKHPTHLNPEKEYELVRVTPLMVACINGHLKMIQFLLQEGGDIDDINRDGSSALVKAVEVGNIDVIQLLVQLGAKVTASHSRGCALTVACYKGDFEVVKALLPGGPLTIPPASDREFVSINCWLAGHIYCAYSCEESPVYLAVRSDHVKIVKWFLEGGVEVPLGALFAAIASNNCDMVEILLQHGADANSTGTGGWSALMLAADVKIVQLLIEYGAKVNARDDEGRYALLYVTLVRTNVTTRNQIEVMRLLLENGADASLTSDRGERALAFKWVSEWVSFSIAATQAAVQIA